DDDVMCLVEVPAQYKTITKRVLRSPATVTDVQQPPVYSTTTKQVLVQEGGVRVEQVPAQYQSVYRQVVDFDKARAMGYKFNEAGVPIATPSGQRLLLASDVVRGPGVQIDASIAPDAWVREVRIPAAYRDVTQYVPTAAAGVEVVQTPAVTRNIRRRELVQPARVENVVVPATYKTVQVQRLVKPETVQEIDIPAQTTTVTHYSVEKPATVRDVPVPEVRKTITHEEVATPASTREEVIPAVYREETRRVIDQPATTRTVDVPAVYKTVTKQVKVADAREEQREVLCASNTPRSRISAVQKALRDAGFRTGADGELDAATMSAVADYQLANSLPTHGYLDAETMQSLGVPMH
ncbi:MAG: peptidoglycan-binding protein, partial [Ottowia sp.]|nr:peptidoglycan-binding protein [Ottowia sp.]